MRRTRNWVLVKSLIAGAGSQADPPDDELLRLRAAGADITRNSRALWIANPGCPRVQQWLRGLTGRHVPRYEPNPEAW